MPPARGYQLFRGHDGGSHVARQRPRFRGAFPPLRLPSVRFAEDQGVEPRGQWRRSGLANRPLAVRMSSVCAREDGHARGDRTRVCCLKGSGPPIERARDGAPIRNRTGLGGLRDRYRAAAVEAWCRPAGSNGVLSLFRRAQSPDLLGRRGIERGGIEWSGRLDSNQRLPASGAGENIQASRRPVGVSDRNGAASRNRTS